MKEAFKIEQLYQLAFALLLSGWLVWWAKRKDFFRLPPPRKEIPLSFLQVLGALSSYITLALIILPFLFLLIGWAITGSLSSLQQLPFVTKGFLQQILLLILFLWAILYTFLLPSVTRRTIYNDHAKRSLKQYAKSAKVGVIALAVSYPLMIVVNLLTSFISNLVFHESGAEQVAVQELKKALGEPWLFSLMLFSVVIFVPVVEELLFRGFLQTWFLRHLPRGGAILLTAFIFALVHYVPRQGIGNIELIASLFVLSCFLGFVYERERTLFAPIVMHSLFNGFSALMIALTS